MVWIRLHDGEDPIPPSITCPVCEMTSYHPTDIAEGYCGHCHDFTSPKRPADQPEEE